MVLQHFRFTRPRVIPVATLLCNAVAYWCTVLVRQFAQRPFLMEQSLSNAWLDPEDNVPDAGDSQLLLSTKADPGSGSNSYCLQKGTVLQRGCNPVCNSIAIIAAKLSPLLKDEEV